MLRCMTHFPLSPNLKKQRLESAYRTLPSAPSSSLRRDVSLERIILRTEGRENDKWLRRVLHDRDEIARRELRNVRKLVLQ